MLCKWLESGFVFNRQLFPTEEGTPQGGIISPTLANMALDGLQAMLAENFKLRRTKMGYFNPMVNLVRYADDFIITCSDRETLETLVRPAVSEFLQARGLPYQKKRRRLLISTKDLIFWVSMLGNIKVRCLSSRQRRMLRNSSPRLKPLFVRIRPSGRINLSDF